MIRLNGFMFLLHRAVLSKVKLMKKMIILN